MRIAPVVPGTQPGLAQQEARILAARGRISPLYQVLLNSLGFAVGIDGVWGPSTAAAVSAYQGAARLPVTGTIDAPTRAVMLTPFAPPIKPAAG